MTTTLLRPLARMLLARVQSELDQVPHPVDAPQYHAPGPDPDRVLIFGNGPAIGFGVRTQELALPGQVGRRLSHLTGRGADIDLVARRRTSVEDAPALVPGLRLNRYDAVVVVLGATDAAALLPLRRWRSAMESLLTALTAAAAPGAPVVVLGIHSLRRSALTSGVLGTVIDEHGRRLNAVTRDLCAADPRLHFIERDEVQADTVRYQSVRAFQLLGEMIASALAAGLTADPPSQSAARRLRAAPEPEHERQAALDALGLVDSADEERFDRITRSARSVFGTRSAAFSLIDHDRQWNKSVAGASRQLPRTASICDRVIRADRTLVIGDLLEDPVANAELLADGYRFYAGHPVESQDGYRIGALCVLDDRPRRAEEFDSALLRALALRLQRELWTSAGPAVAGAATR